MNKAQAIYKFWTNFDLPVFDENSVPTGQALPYITYTTVEDSIDYPVSLHGSLWYRTDSWTEIEKKANEISKYIGLSGQSIPIDTGYAWITRGTPFAQRMNDPNDSIRRIYINLMVEFLSAD